MKRSGIIIALAVALSSCTHETVPPEFAPLSITTGGQTKTVLDGTAVRWTDDDQVAVFDDLHYLNQFDAVSVDNSSAVFEGKVAARTTDFYAVYPYACAISADDDNIIVRLPSIQEAAAGTFAEDLNISVAHGTKSVDATEADGLIFRNTCALLKFTIPSMFTSIVEATFTADNRSLAGSLVYSKDEACLMDVLDDEHDSNRVTLKGNLKGGQTYYFVVSPGVIEGFSLTVKDASGVVLTNSSEKSFEAKAGVIRDLGEVKIVVTPNIRVEHVYSSGAHTGTNIWFDLGLPSGMEQYVESVEGWISKSGQIADAYRIISMERNYGTVKFPYLTLVFINKNVVPAGSYILHVRYVISGLGLFEEDIPVVVPAS
jgi:hypothetical protein